MEIIDLTEFSTKDLIKIIFDKESTEELKDSAYEIAHNRLSDDKYLKEIAVLLAPYVAEAFMEQGIKLK